MPGGCGSICFHFAYNLNMSETNKKFLTFLVHISETDYHRNEINEMFDEIIVYFNL